MKNEFSILYILFLIICLTYFFISTILAEKKMSYGEFVTKVHKPAICPKKKNEMDDLISRLKHPVKESKKIPSSYSYHNLYNINGEHPWNSISQYTAESRKTPMNVSRQLLNDTNKVRNL